MKAQGTGTVRGRHHGFTLIEVIVSTAIFALLFAVLLTGVGETRRAWDTAESTAEEFRETRRAFDAMTRRVGQATLNNYWGYDDPASPTLYLRHSELHFACGPAFVLLPTPAAPVAPATGPRLHTGHCLFFQAPLGYSGEDAGSAGNAAYNRMDDLVNGWGYFVEYGSDMDGAVPFRPTFLNGDLERNPERKRFRLMEYRLPSERLPVYVNTSAPPPATGTVQWQASDISRQTNRDGIGGWYRDNPQRAAFSRPIAENVVAVIFSPRAPGAYEDSAASGSAIDDYFLAPNYEYNSRRHQWVDDALAKVSRHAMPPVVQVSCVAVDEKSFALFEAIEGASGVADLKSTIDGLFTVVDDYDDDMATLEQYLVEHRLEYEVMVANVPIRGAKWVTERDF